MTRAVILLTLTLLASSAWAGTLIDDFEDGNLDGWRPSKFFGDEEAKWSVERGELVVTAKNFCRTGPGLGIGDETWEDYEFSVRFSLRKTFRICSEGWSPAIGIGIHSNVAETGSLQLGKNQWVWAGVFNRQLDRGNNGWARKLCEVWIPPDDVLSLDRGEFLTRPRRWYTLRISAFSTRLRTKYVAVIGNKQICDFSLDIRFESGKRTTAGGAFLYVRNAEVHFDNVVITGENIPNLDMNEFLPVSRKGKLATTWGEIKKF